MAQFIHQRTARRKVKFMPHIDKIRTAEHAAVCTGGSLHQRLLCVAVAVRQSADTGHRRTDRAQRIPAQHLPQFMPEILTGFITGFAHGFARIPTQQQDQLPPSAEKAADAAFLPNQTFRYGADLLPHGIFRQTDNADKILLCGQRQAPASALHCRFCGRYPAGKQVIQEMFTQNVLFLFTAAVFSGGTKLHLLLFDLRGNLFERFHKLRRTDRLEQIRIGVQGNRLLCILEFIVAAEKNNAQPRHRAPHDLCQLQTVHERHTNIGDQHVRFHFDQHGKRHFAVRRFSGKQKPSLLLFNAVADTVPYDLLVICDKYAHHIVLSSCPSGTVKLMRVPCRYSLSIVNPLPQYSRSRCATLHKP